VADKDVPLKHKIQPTLDLLTISKLPLSTEWRASIFLPGRILPCRQVWFRLSLHHLPYAARTKIVNDILTPAFRDENKERSI
jgi:hypothetical protein